MTEQKKDINLILDIILLISIINITEIIIVSMTSTGISFYNLSCILLLLIYSGMLVYYFYTKKINIESILIPTVILIISILLMLIPIGINNNYEYHEKLDYVETAQFSIGNILRLTKTGYESLNFVAIIYFIIYLIIFSLYNENIENAYLTVFIVEIIKIIMSFTGFNDAWLGEIISMISIIAVPYIFIISLVYLVHKNIKKHIKKTEDIKENIENDK